MGTVTFAQSSFLGGEVSQAYQGRFDRPDYRTFMNLCRNSIPIESGAVLRRPPTRHCGPTKNGLPARVITFDFKEAASIAMEFTDGCLRCWAGRTLVTVSSTKTSVSSISTANPAVVQTAGGPWSTSDTVMFTNLVGADELANRPLVITVLSPVTFTLRDALTGDVINGSALTTFVNGNVAKVLEISTSYLAGSWANLRSVQAEKQAVLLNGTLPQVLTVTADPTAISFATLALTSANFLDGPYLDPIPGSYVTASAQSGVVNLTFSFQPYDSAKAYNIGDYVSNGGVAYKSRTANNQGNTPAGSPTNWLVVNGGDPINHGAGFTSADVGRLARLFSEPALWDSAATYAAKQSVAYTDGEGGYGYWTATGAIGAGVQPGTSTLWAPNATGALWTWGRILSVSASGVAAPNTTFGSMSSGGGTAAAFDSNTSKSMASSANSSENHVTAYAWVPAAWPIGAVVQYLGVTYTRVAAGDDSLPPNATRGVWTSVGTVTDLTLSGYVGGHFTSATAVGSATLFPTADMGITNGSLVTVNLRAKATLPASLSDGTLLGTTGVIANPTTPITIASNDASSTFNYIWFEIVTTHIQPLPANGGAGPSGSFVYIGYVGVAQMVIYAPNVANGSVVSFQIAGDAMLYANTVRKWRLGAYGGANGWPFCGTYHEGRLCLAGVIDNRMDGGKPIDTNNNLFNFAPTRPNGTVADDNAITAVFDSKDVNAIFWMESDEQGIICGTQAGEWMISPAAPGALSPTNISAKRRTKVGCANIEPRRTDHTLIFVQKYLRKLMEYFADVYSGKMSAPNLTLKSKHLTVPNVVEIAYQQELAPIVWQRLQNGGLVGTTYKRDKLTTAQEPEIAAAHFHTLGSGRVIESICVGPSSGGNLDSLTMVTNDTATNLRHVEVLDDLFDEGFSQSRVAMVDNGIIPSSIVEVVPSVGAPYGGIKINGLRSHNGKNVDIAVCGVDCGASIVDGVQTYSTFTVANGSVTVPFADGNDAGNGNGKFTRDLLASFSATLSTALIPMAVGFTYTSRGQIVRPAQQAESGSQAGVGFGKEHRIDRYAVQLYGAITRSISFGTDFANLIPFYAKNAREDEYTVLQPWSGIYRAQPEANTDFDNMLCWEMTRPNAAAFVIALGGRVNTTD